MSTSAFRLSISRKMLATANVRPPRLNRTATSLAAGSPSISTAVPLLGVADVVDRHVVVRAPEERDIVVRPTQSEHVACGSLTLALRVHPVLHADALAGIRVGVSCDVTGGEHVRRARFQKLVHSDTAVDGQFRVLGQSECGA